MQSSQAHPEPLSRVSCARSPQLRAVKLSKMATAGLRLEAIRPTVLLAAGS